MKKKEKEKSDTALPYFETKRYFGLEGRVIANGPRDLSRTQKMLLKKMVFDATLLNTRPYKVRIKGEVEQSWERSSNLSYSSVL